MKPELLDKTGIFLLKKGFTVKTLTRTCFDIVARKQSNILFLKILEDANSISPEYAEQMVKVAHFFAGAPLIIAEKATSKLLDSVVYSRLGIYTLNLSTFKDCINNKFPFIVRDQAGLKAFINGESLRKRIEEERLSLSGLAKKLGVSTSMIHRYENGSSITVKKAMRLYGLLGPGVFGKINIFQPINFEISSPSDDITGKYQELGFKAEKASKVPFDVMAKKEDNMILTEVGDKAKPEFQSLGKLIDADNLMIFKKRKPKDIPSLTKEEFMDFEKAHELIRFIKEGQNA